MGDRYSVIQSMCLFNIDSNNKLKIDMF